MKTESFLWLLLIGCMMIVVGCGPSGPPLGSVTGTVTLDGKAVPGALVTFISKAPNGSSSFGKTDENGKYRLEFTTERYGAFLGAHEVEIVTKRVSSSEMPDTAETGKATPEVFVPIPKHYARGALTAEVKAGNNVFDFSLTTKPK